MLLDFLNKRKGGNEAEMSFMDHLEELRWHIARSVLAIAVAGVVLFLNKSFLFDTLILGPMHDNFPTYHLMCLFGQKIGLGNSTCIDAIHFKLTSIDMTSQFMIHLEAAFTVGMVLVFPYILWELWRFISPALYEKERKSVTGVVLVGSLLFYLGLLFGYYMIAPCTVVFLGEYSVSDMVSNTFSLDSYMDTVSGLALISGLVFEFPMVIYFLATLGIISAAFLRKYRRYAIVICLFMAAVITPSPDMFTCTIVTIPIYGLYEVGILAAVRVERQRKKRDKEIFGR